MVERGTGKLLHLGSDIRSVPVVIIPYASEGITLELNWLRSSWIVDCLRETSRTGDDNVVKTHDRFHHHETAR